MRRLEEWTAIELGLDGGESCGPISIGFGEQAVADDQRKGGLSERMTAARQIFRRSSP